MAAQQWTLRGLYDSRKSEIGTDKITDTLGRALATPFSEDISLEIDTSVITDQWLTKYRGGIIDTNKYSESVDKQTA